MPLSRRLPPGLAGRIGGSVSGICRRGHIVMEDRRANCPTGQSARASCTAPRRYEPHYSQLPASVKSPCRRASRERERGRGAGGGWVYAVSGIPSRARRTGRSRSGSGGVLFNTGRCPVKEWNDESSHRLNCRTRANVSPQGFASSPAAIPTASTRASPTCLLERCQWVVQRSDTYRTALLGRSPLQ